MAFLICALISSCSPAVAPTPYPTYTPAPTQTSLPTYTPFPTFTPIPTSTPIPLPTATEKPKENPGIDVPLFVEPENVSFLVNEAVYAESYSFDYIDNNNKLQTFTATPKNTQKDHLVIVNFSAGGILSNVAPWTNVPDNDAKMHILDDNGKSEFLWIISWNQKTSTIVMVFIVERNAKSLELVFPEGSRINLDSFLKP